jgi:hypothetical protein
MARPSDKRFECITANPEITLELLTRSLLPAV